MDIDNIIKIINGVGFPIVMCLALFYTNTYMLNQQGELLNEFKDAVNSNVIAYEARTNRAEYIISRIENIDNRLGGLKCLP